MEEKSEEKGADDGDTQCPIGPWPADKKAREIGTYALMSIDSDLEGEFQELLHSSVRED